MWLTWKSNAEVFSILTKILFFMYYGHIQTLPGGFCQNSYPKIQHFFIFLDEVKYLPIFPRLSLKWFLEEKRLPLDTIKYQVL